VSFEAPDPRDPARSLLGLLAGKWIAAAIAAAAELGLADALAARGPLGAAALATELGCDEQGLTRLLGILVGEGLLEVDERERYSLTAIGAELRTEALRDLARYMGAPFTWAPFAHVAPALRQGRSAFELAHGESIFRYLDTHPAEAEVYQRGIDTFTRREAQALSQAFDFGAARCVVDVGGGLGTLLVEVLARFPALRGVLVDRPAVIAQAERALEYVPERGRIELYPADFFERLPATADVYVLKHVLHNWDDERALQLLRNCADSLPDDGKVIIVDGYLLPGGRRDATRLLDLEMFVLCGAGRERRKPEFRRLLHRAGLKLLRSQALAGTTCMIIAVKR
jgi:DNA-binding MarR family transcriptional regulator